MKPGLKIILGLVVTSFMFVSHLYAEDSIHVKVTAIMATNEGTDFNLENDAFRDQLISLFSYTSYKEMDQFRVVFRQPEEKTVALPNNYKLSLDYQGKDGAKLLFGIQITKAGKEFLKTQASIVGESPLFLGGPPINGGVLILSVEPMS